MENLAQVVSFNFFIMQSLAKWDVTIKKSLVPSYLDLAKTFKKIAKKWVFQEEKGEATGFEHYQCRISLHKKQRLKDLLKSLESHELKGVHLSPTSNPGTSNFDYVMKEQTRIEGPWDDRSYDKLVKREKKEQNMPMKTKKLIARGLPPWMKQCLMWRENQLNEDTHDDRSIHWIYDPVGGVHMKSSFEEYCWYYDLAYGVSKSTDIDKMEIFTIGEAEEKEKDDNQVIALIIDIERANNDKSEDGLYTYLEKIKNGKFSTWKYNSRGVRQPFYPIVYVFANHLPKEEKLTGGRFNVWTFNLRDELEEYDETTIDILTEYWSDKWDQIVKERKNKINWKQQIPTDCLPHLKRKINSS